MLTRDVLAALQQELPGLSIHQLQGLLKFGTMVVPKSSDGRLNWRTEDIARAKELILQRQAKRRRQLALKEIDRGG